MKESDWRYVVDALLFVCLVGMVFIGVLLGFFLSEGPVYAGGSKYFLGLHRHQWGNIHAYLSIAFVILMVIHLLLSWKWIMGKTRQIFKKGAAPALIGIAVVPFGLLFLFLGLTPKDADTYQTYGVGPGQGQRTMWIQPKEAPRPTEEAARRDDARVVEKSASPPVVQEHIGEEEHRSQVGSVTITGQQTLCDLETATGIPARTIAARLGLPENVGMNETLGRLRQLYGFEIQTVRDVVARLIKEKGSGAGLK